MRKTILTSILLFLIFMFLAGPANASTVSFGDTVKIWPGQGNSTSQDNEDVIGIPNITGGTYTISGSILQSITFTYTGDNKDVWWALVPGDLFIDTDANGTWDYVAVNGGEKSAGYWDVYSIDVAVGSKTDYITSNDAGRGFLRGTGDAWGDWQVRNGHPVGIDDSVISGETAIGSIYFDGWDNLAFNGQMLESIFDFSGLSGGGLDVGDGGWIFGWTVNCGNDVIYQHGSEVPIPGAVWLLGSGLLGLIGVRRKLKK